MRRLGHHLRDVHHRVFGKTAAHTAEHRIADLDAGHAFTDRVHDAGGFTTAEFFGAAMHHAADKQFAAV